MTNGHDPNIHCKLPAGAILDIDVSRTFSFSGWPQGGIFGPAIARMLFGRSVRCDGFEGCVVRPSSQPVRLACARMRLASRNAPLFAVEIG
jgi:hypothetical protein